jgi:hypothetical protein
MAILADTDRKVIWAEFMSAVSNINEPVTGLTKAELKAAVDAIDTFMSNNATALNTAIPQPARGALSIAQKARLLSMVIKRRYIMGV